MDAASPPPSHWLGFCSAVINAPWRNSGAHLGLQETATHPTKPPGINYHPPGLKVIYIGNWGDRQMEAKALVNNYLEANPMR